MASIDTGGGDKHAKGGKKKQKKVTLRVDFTPMVDMNMLLITFFMFCTSLSKPNTMEINMPTKEVDVKDKTEVKASEAVTILLAEDNKVYYYLGQLEENSYLNPEFLVLTDFSPQGLRKMLLSRNVIATKQMDELKLKKINNEISEMDFRKQSAEIKGAKGTPVVIIKATESATYKDLIAALDEMQICNVGRYAIMDITESDQFLLDNAALGGAMSRAALEQQKESSTRR